MINQRIKPVIAWGIPIIAVAALLIAYCFVSYQLATAITLADRKPLAANPAAFGLEYEDVQFPARGDDLTLRGWYIPAESNGPAIILVHGLGSNREEDEAFFVIASGLAERGYSSLLFDLRGHGTSDGDTVSGGYYERRDVLGAFDYLVNRGVPSNEIGVLGFSMGAATSALSVAQEPKIQALAIDSAFANVSDMIAQETALKTPIPEFAAYTFIPGMDTFAKLFYGIDIGEIVPEYAVKRLDYPILIIHGLGDTRISSENSNRIFGAAHESSELWLVPGVEHTGTVRTYPEEYIDRVTAYLDARLRAD